MATKIRKASMKVPIILYIISVAFTILVSLAMTVLIAMSSAMSLVSFVSIMDKLIYILASIALIMVFVLLIWSISPIYQRFMPTTRRKR